jgi:hypothetical protein
VTRTVISPSSIFSSSKVFEKRVGRLTPLCRSLGDISYKDAAHVKLVEIVIKTTYSTLISYRFLQNDMGHPNLFLDSSMHDE